MAPLIVLEFASDNGHEERDRTPLQGKFWIYGRILRPPFYGIYEIKKANVDVYELVHGQYQPITPNERKHYPIQPLSIELGIWQGQYQNMALPWLHWWDHEGNLLLSGEERAEQEHQRAEQEHQRAEQEHQQAQRLAAVLREHGIDPDLQSA